VTERTRHFLEYRLPAILWALVIFTASSIPGSKFPKFILRVNDKVIHVTIFLVLGLLVFRALEPRIRKNSFDWLRAIISTSVVTAYGALDEIHQIFVPGRTADVWDATADALGAVLSALILFLIFRWRREGVRR
jgi:VanZ family protein